MAHEIEFHQLAMGEYVSAYNWYEDKKVGLGERFIKEMRNRLELIQKNPLQFKIKKGRFRETRIEVFPYTIVYQVFKTKNLIFVSAIYHGKRNPRRKFRKRT